MGKIAGVDVLVKIKSGSTLTVIGGQSGATLTRGTNLIEVTSKDAAGWAESVAGVKNWSIECEGFLVSDDAALNALEQAWLANAVLDVDISLPSGKTYAGKVLVGELGNEFPQDDAASFSISFTGTGPLTITSAAA